MNRICPSLRLRCWHSNACTNYDSQYLHACCIILTSRTFEYNRRSFISVIHYICCDSSQCESRFEIIPRAYEDDVDVHVGRCVDAALGRSKMGMSDRVKIAKPQNAGRTNLNPEEWSCTFPQGVFTRCVTLSLLGLLLCQPVNLADVCRCNPSLHWPRGKTTRKILSYEC